MNASFLHYFAPNILDINVMPISIWKECAFHSQMCFENVNPNNGIYSTLGWIQLFLDHSLYSLILLLFMNDWELRERTTTTDMENSLLLFDTICRGSHSVPFKWFANVKKLSKRILSKPVIHYYRSSFGALPVQHWCRWSYSCSIGFWTILSPLRTT